MKQRGRKTLCWLLALVMLLGLLPGMSLTALAATGSGTETDPWVVGTWSELKEKMALGGFVQLGDDITCPESERMEGSAAGPLAVPAGKTVTLDLNGKTLSRGLTAPTKWGQVIHVKGTMTLMDSSATNAEKTDGTGKITGGFGIYHYGESDSGANFGGCIYIPEGGSLTMESGAISGNTLGYTATDNFRSDGGGGVFVRGTFIMNGGCITDNHSECSGGGVLGKVYCNIVINGGLIANNSAVRNGGGVYFYDTRTTDNIPVKITGGVIRDNSCLANGGGVCVIHGTTVMTGGTVTDNTSGADGGGLYVGTLVDNLKLSGDPVIAGNAQSNGKVSNLYLYDGKVIQVTDGGLSEDALIGVSMQDYSDPFATGLTGDDYLRFFSDNTSYQIGKDGKMVEGHIHDGIVFEKWTATDSLPTEAGNWVLMNDVVLPKISNPTHYGLWDVPQGETNLCLNGHGIYPDSTDIDNCLIRVVNGATLNLYDCGTVTRYVTMGDYILNGVYASVPSGYDPVDDSGNGYVAVTGGFIGGAHAYKYAGDGGGGVRIEKTGEFNMYGGTILGNQTVNGGSGVRDYGTFNMYDGAICYNKTRGDGGAGVRVMNASTQGTFNMYGGTIAYNRTTGSTAKGAGVWLDHGTMTMESGAITGNVTAYQGGGIYVGNGVLHLSGNPVVTGNKAKTSDDNIYLSGGKTIIIDSVLSGGADIRVRTEKTPGDTPVAITGGWNLAMADADPADYFTSDGGYTVSRSADGQEAALTKKNSYFLTVYSDIALETIDENLSGYHDLGDSLSFLKDSAPELALYTFVGWTETKKEGDGDYPYQDTVPDTVTGKTAVEFFDPDSTMPAGSLTLYPVYVKDRLYVVLDKGADDVAVPDGQGLLFHVNVNEKIRMRVLDDDGKPTDRGINTFSRPGYALTGWWTQGNVLWNGDDWKNANTEDTWWPMTYDYWDKGADGQPERKYEAEKNYHYYFVTLTAHWKLADAVVEFDPGEGATFTVPDEADRTVTAGGTYVLPTEKPVKANSAFLGWKVDVQDGKTYQPGNSLRYVDLSEVTTLGGETTPNEIKLVAQYQKLEPSVYYIAFDTSVGTAVATQTYTVEHDAVLVTIEDPGTVTADGYTFDNWFVKDGGSETELVFTGGKAQVAKTLADDKNVIYVYAKWTKNSYTITYLDGEKEFAKKTVPYGEAIPEIAPPTKEFYTFGGWLGLPQTMPARSFSVSASWRPNTYTVRFVNDGAALAEDQSVHFGGEIKVPAVEDTESRAFDGWAGSDGKRLESEPTFLDKALAGLADANGTVTVSALWKDKYAITVTGGTADKTYALENDTVIITAAIPEGKAFDKWTSDDVTFADANAAKTIFVMPAKNVSVTAVFKDAEEEGGGDEPVEPVYPAGGDSAPASHKIILPESTEHGKLSASARTAAQGALVTLTAVPDEGYRLDQLTVKDAGGRTVALTDKGNGTWTFTMPNSDVTVSASFVPTSEKAPIQFVDVPADAWYYDDVCWAAENGITLGTDATHFSPNDDCTRGQFVTFLWRAAGKPAPAGTANPFEDVSAEDYFFDAVLWAVENGITTGVDAAHFLPDAPVTRAQAITLLYRYEQSIGKGFTGLWSFQLDYPDVADVPEWAYEAFCWMVKEDICKGSDGQLLPGKNCLRCEVVALLARCFAE